MASDIRLRTPPKNNFGPTFVRGGFGGLCCNGVGGGGWYGFGNGVGGGGWYGFGIGCGGGGFGDTVAPPVANSPSIV